MGTFDSILYLYVIHYYDFYFILFFYENLQIITLEQSQISYSQILWNSANTRYETKPAFLTSCEKLWVSQWLFTHEPTMFEQVILVSLAIDKSWIHIYSFKTVLANFQDHICKA